MAKRSWTMTAGIVQMVSIVTFLVAYTATTLLAGLTWRTDLLIVVLLSGVIAGLVWRSFRGVEAIHRRVAAVRSAWAHGREGAAAEPDGVPDPRDIALALPRGWRAVAARGRMRLTMSGTTVRAETWVLEAAAGSRRAPRRRELVRTSVVTGGVRVWVPVGVAVDSLLVKPAWARSPDVDGPVWLPAVRDRVARHTDILSSLTIGDDRVVLFSLDDPRPETTVERARLVTDVADIISGRMG